MTLILESGGGIRGANSYVLRAFVTAYLTDRDRETENGWSTALPAKQDAACIAATAYMDTRWRARLRGFKMFTFQGACAVSQFNLDTNPANDETLSLGALTYTFKTSLSAFGEAEVLIGADTAATTLNLVAAINGATLSGAYSTSLEQSRSASAALVEGEVDQVRLTAVAAGASGNDITLSTTSGGISIVSPFVHGRDQGSQDLEFPRATLHDARGHVVLGVPLKWKQACAEYASRALAAMLFQDPVTDTSGRAVVEKFEKVGPIEERTRFEEGGALSQLIKAYPAADQLVAEYMSPLGRVERG